MASRVVGIASRRLTISNGDWLLVKDRLNHGEEQDAFARRYVATEFGHRVNLRAAGMDLVTAYLLDWSLTGLDEQVLEIRGRPIPDLESALNSIDAESFTEIHAAIDTHVAAMAAERDAKKKTPPGAPGSSPISLSPASAPAPSATETSDNSTKTSIG